MKFLPTKPPKERPRLQKTPRLLSSPMYYFEDQDFTTTPPGGLTTEKAINDWARLLLKHATAPWRPILKHATRRKNKSN